MNLEQGDIITLSTDEFLILDVIMYDGNEYAFGNKITTDEEPTDEFYAFKVSKNGENVLKVTDESELNLILPLFSKNIQNLVNEMLDKR